MVKKKRGRQPSEKQEVNRALEEWDSTGAIVEGATDPYPDVPPCYRCFEDDGLGYPERERIMHEQKSPNLGAPPGEHAKRDAVHIAVAPVVAGEPLQPGQHVGLLEDGRAYASAKPIGIVDPFSTDAVVAGLRFWLFLYPGTVTSLRHDWTHPHPAFADDSIGKTGNQ